MPKKNRQLFSISMDSWPIDQGCQMTETQTMRGTLQTGNFSCPKAFAKLNEKFLSAPTQFLSGETMSPPDDYACCPS